MLVERFRIIFLFAVSFVLTVWPHPQPIGLYYPQFMLVSLIIAAFFNPEIKWVAWACVTGLLIDLITLTPLGWHALLFCLPVWVTCYWRHNFNINNLLQLLVIVGCLLAIAELWVLLLGAVFALPAMSALFWLSIPASLLWAALLWYAVGSARFALGAKYK